MTKETLERKCRTVMYEYLTLNEAGITNSHDIALLGMLKGALLSDTRLPSGYSVKAEAAGHVVIPFELDDEIVLVEVPKEDTPVSLEVETIVPRRSVATEVQDAPKRNWFLRWLGF